MALLFDRTALGRADQIIAPDLARATEAVRRRVQTPENAGTFDIARSRQWVSEFASLASEGAPFTAIHRVDALEVTPAGPVPVRIYQPDARAGTIVYVHGGGWVICSLDTHDSIAAWLAAETGARVVSVGYSLAPEHPYPAAVNECAAILVGVLDQVGQTHGPVFVAGDSAGANLAAMALLRLAPEQQRAVAGFVSIYGAFSPAMNLSSHKLYGDGRFGLSGAEMRWFWNLYAPHIPQDERAMLTPLGQDLGDFPSTLCVGAECDLLLDDTLALYSELARARVDVSLALWPALSHGCLHFVGVVDSVTQAASAITRFVERRCQTGMAVTSTTRQHVSQFVLPAVGSAEESGTADVEPLFLTSRSRLHGSLAHRIAAGVIGGEFPPGSLLPNEDKASASFGVSRTAYREAIRTLAAKGLLTALPKVGTRIAERAAWHLLDPDVLAWHLEAEDNEEFIRGLFELRKIVEPSAASLTASRRNDTDLSALADAMARMARFDPRTGGWLAAIIQFHQVLFTACGNEAVAALWPAISTTLRWSVRLQMMLPDFRLTSEPVADHARVFETIAARNHEGALREMAVLIDAALDDTLSNLHRIRSFDRSVGEQARS